MTPPVLGLLVGADPPPALRALLLALAGRTRIADVAGAAAPAPAAVLEYREVVPPPDGTPYAVWLGALDDLDRPLVTGAAVLLTSVPAVAEAAGDRDVVLVPDAARHAEAVPVAPHVRARLRAARGLPSAPVATGSDAGWTWGEPPRPIDPAIAATAAGCAAAVVATGDALPLALAWGAPTVTDAVSARAAGARDGGEVLVERDPARRRDRAAALAADVRLAARLSWAGRRLFERRHSLPHAAAEVAARLGLGDGRSPRERVAARLDELGAPADARIRDRAAAALTGLPARPAGTEGDR